MALASPLDPCMETYCLQSASQAFFHRRPLDPSFSIAEIQMPSEAQLRSAMEIVIVAKDFCKDEKLVSEIKKVNRIRFVPDPGYTSGPFRKFSHTLGLLQ